MTGEKRSVIRTTLTFAVVGGLGMPIVFIVLWQILHRITTGQRFINLMEWFEAIRVMLWPTAALLVYRSPNDSGQWTDIVFATIWNLCIYGVIGLLATLAVNSRGAQAALVFLVLAGMCALNFFWSNHLGSFILTALVVLVFFGTFFRRLGQFSPR